MSHYVTLDMTYTYYSMLLDTVMEAARHAEDFPELYELVHLYDFLEDEYLRDQRKQNAQHKVWEMYDELFTNNEIYHREYFLRVKGIFDNYQERELLDWNISEQVKFHMICEIIDVFKKDDCE